MVLVALAGLLCLCWQGHPFCVKEVVLGGFSFVPPDLFSQFHSLPVVVGVLEEG